MKKLTGMALGMLVLVPALAFSDSFTLRIGYSMPRGVTDSYMASHPDSLWTIELDQMSFSKTKFQGSTWGASYEYFASKNLSLVLAVDGYSKQVPGYYVEYGQFELDEGNFAFPAEYYSGYYIEHSFRVSNTPLMFSVKLLPMGRKSRVIPFLGGGGGVYFWAVRIYGETIDFSDPWIYPDPDLGDIEIYPVVFTDGRESGAAFGFHAFGGVQIPIAFRATIDLEARYHWASAPLNDWFLGFDDFDLGGLCLVAGFSYWF